MKSIIPALMAVMLPTVAQAAAWESDYATALQIAKQQDKPLLVYFNKVTEGSEGPFKGQESLLDNFVLLQGNKLTPNGERLHELFEIKADEAFVVVERDQKWQYARFQRPLGQDEVRVLLTKTATAKGKPVSEVSLVREDSSQAARLQTTTFESYYPARSSYCPNCRR